MRTRLSLVVSVAALTLLPVGGPAAQISNTPEMEELARSHGQANFFEIMPQMMQYYSGVLKNAPADGVRVTMDLGYGPDSERHLLDVYQPDPSPGDSLPVLVFVHGGGFTQGHKNQNDLIYANIGNYFARQGILTVVPTYRLAPDHQWPAGVEDMAGVVSWLRENIADYGGDRDQIFLMGQSAGAIHVASYVFNEAFHVDDGDDGVAGAILISGVYDISGTETDHAYYGEDTSVWPDREISGMVDGRAIPLFILDMEYDPLRQQLSTVNLIASVCQRDGTCPRYAHIPGHNHITGIWHINTADDSYGADVLEFIDMGK